MMIDYVKRGIAKGFKFDGCTNAPNLNVLTCCNRHDYDYQDMALSRVKADKRLRECMQKKGHPILAWVYWGFVRAFGASHFARKQRETYSRINDGFADRLQRTAGEIRKQNQPDVGQQQAVD